MDALTQSTWEKVLDRIVRYGGNQTSQTLAAMLLDIINTTTDPAVDEILDTYGRRLLGPL